MQSVCAWSIHSFSRCASSQAGCWVNTRRHSILNLGLFGNWKNLRKSSPNRKAAMVLYIKANINYQISKLYPQRILPFLFWDEISLSGPGWTWNCHLPAPVSQGAGITGMCHNTLLALSCFEGGLLSSSHFSWMACILGIPEESISIVLRKENLALPTNWWWPNLYLIIE